MQYISTRGETDSAPFLDILLEGLAPDGGLYLPKSYPQVDEETLQRWRSLNYPQLAEEILSLFISDVPNNALHTLIDNAYQTGHFSHPNIVSFTTLAPNFHLLGLSHGPSLAFKDMALQVLGELFEYALVMRNSHLNILGATSGDTGSSAEYALKGKSRMRVFMLSPFGKMSAFQQAQMYSLQDENIHNLALRGAFDEAQGIVKTLSSDAPFKAQHRLGAVNSINWARVAAQIVYYFFGYFSATRKNSESVAFAVPSGNFGNICAGHIARQMGLPIHQLILATNENDVLDEFFKTGMYAPRNQTTHTSSPSMDISNASNLERFIFDVVGHDANKVRVLWRELAQGKPANLSTEHPRFSREFGFSSGRSTHADRLQTISRVYRDFGVMVDPHTADGIKVGLQIRQKDIPLICLETAQPVKFDTTMREALGVAPPTPPEFADLEQRPLRYTLMDAKTHHVRDYINRHSLNS